MNVVPLSVEQSAWGGNEHKEETPRRTQGEEMSQHFKDKRGKLQKKKCSRKNKASLASLKWIIIFINMPRYMEGGKWHN